MSVTKKLLPSYCFQALIETSSKPADSAGSNQLENFNETDFNTTALCAVV